LNTVRALGPSARPGRPCARPPESNARSRSALWSDTDANRFWALGCRSDRRFV